MSGPGQAELCRRLSHELRSPLNVLDGALEELPALSDPEERGRLLTLARRAVHRLARLADRLALAGHPEGLAQAAAQRVDAAALARDEWRALQAAQPRSRVTFEVSGEGTLEGDPGLLAATVGELLSNAARNAREKVEVHVAPGRLAVEDDGRGLAEGALGRLLEGGAVSPVGLGLGLPLVAQLTARLGLTLEVERARHGALCRFVLKR